MTYYARIRDGVVREVRELEDIEGRFHESITWVEADSTVDKGDRYDADADVFEDPPAAVVQIAEDGRVRSRRTRPLEPVEGRDEWIVAPDPPTVDDLDGYDTVRYYDPDTEEWTHEYHKQDPDNVRREYTSEDSRKAVRDAIDAGDLDRAIEELAHIVTGDDMFEAE